MLMADAGERLREIVARERSLARWLEILPLYAGVQIDLAPRRGGTRRARRAGHAAGRPAGEVRDAARAVGSSSDDERSSAPARRCRGCARRARSWRLRHPGDDPARRLPRRPGLRQGRPLPADGLGRRLRLAPVLHALGDAGGRDSRGASTTSRTRRTSRRTATPTSQPFAAARRRACQRAADLALRLGWACRVGQRPHPGRPRLDPCAAADVPRRPRLGGLDRPGVAGVEERLEVALALALRGRRELLRHELVVDRRSTSRKTPNGVAPTSPASAATARTPATAPRVVRRGRSSASSPTSATATTSHRAVGLAHDPRSPSAPKRIGSPCSGRSGSPCPRARSRRRRRCRCCSSGRSPRTPCPCARRPRAAPRSGSLRSVSIARATNDRLGADRDRERVERVVERPIGVDFVTLPSSEVGEYWPFVSP